MFLISLDSEVQYLTEDEQRLAERVQQTSLLLDEYTAILGQAEHTQRLLLNPRWTGSSDVRHLFCAFSGMLTKSLM